MREVDYDAAPKRYEQEYLATEQTWVTDQLEREFWKSFYEDMKTWESNDMRENDERVYKAIIVLFESKDDIEIFNKKAIYLFNINKRYDLDGDFKFNTARLINHSCSNNCDYDGKGLKLWVTAIKDIKKRAG